MPIITYHLHFDKRKRLRQIIIDHGGHCIKKKKEVILTTDNLCFQQRQKIWEKDSYAQFTDKNLRQRNCLHTEFCLKGGHFPQSSPLDSHVEIKMYKWLQGYSFLLHCKGRNKRKPLEVLPLPLNQLMEKEFIKIHNTWKPLNNFWVLSFMAFNIYCFAISRT